MAIFGTRETLKYSRVCVRDRLWSSGKARCRSGSDSTGPVTQRRQGPKPAVPSGLGRIFPECGVALLDRRITVALRSAPCLEKNADFNAGVRIFQRFPREALIYSRVCARDRFWSSGKARCRFGSDSTGPVTQRRQGPKPAGPFGLGRIFPDCCVALLDRRMTAALRSAPCLEKNVDANAAVRIDQSFPRAIVAGGVP